MDAAETQYKEHVRFEEFNKEPESEVAKHEQSKEISVLQFLLVRNFFQDEEQNNQKKHLVQGKGMALQSISQVHARNKRGRDTVGELICSREKTTDPSDKDACNDRQRKEVAGRMLFFYHSFREFYTQEPAEQSAHDGFQIVNNENIQLCEFGVFQECHNSRAKKSAGGRAQNYREPG